MFNMNEVAKKIKSARNAKNMTQMELADAMGVSYQAVSNWERGNSMPDISKFPDLCNALDLSYEELLGEGHSTKTVKKVIEDSDTELSYEELKEVAPIIPPKKVERVIEENKKEKKKIDFETLIAIAPFLDDEYLDELAENLALDNLSQLVALAPFLSEETLDKIVTDYDGPVTDLIGLAPFLEEDTLGRLIMQYEGNTSDIVGLAPFLDEDALDVYVTKHLENGALKVEELISLCPFLDEDTVRKIADYIMRKGEYSAMAAIAPFM